MKGEIIPEIDHVSRLCGGSTLAEDGSVTAAAFMLKEDEAYLSVNWLEHLGLPNRDLQIAEIRRVMAVKFRRVGTTARLAVANVGVTRSIVRNESSDSRELQCRHEPEVDPNKPDPSHSGIYNTHLDETSIAMLLSKSFSGDTYPAK